MQASDLTRDTTAPRVASFELDMSTGVLRVVFTETVNATSVQPQGFVLQHAGVVSDLDGVYRLTGGAVASVSLDTVTITMTRGDLNGVKAREAMCTHRHPTRSSVWMMAASLT